VVTNLMALATPGAVVNAGEKSPNLLLYVEPSYGVEDPPPPGTEPEPAPVPGPYPKPLPFFTRVTLQLVYDNSPSETTVKLHRRYFKNGDSDWEQEGYVMILLSRLAIETLIRPSTNSHTPIDVPFFYRLFCSHAQSLGGSIDVIGRSTGHYP
jgi:hypothetical protein